MPFSQKTLDFLAENQMQNSKSWFAEHKENYQEYVLNPLAELVVGLSDTIKSIDESLICEPKVGKCISRIYRDTRYSHDKSIYRDIMWVVFTTKRQLSGGPPGYFFELSPRGFRYGCGFCQADRITMENLRRLVLENSKEFQSALSAFENQSVFAIEGELYKRDRFPDAPEHLKTWLNRKEVGLIHNSTDFPLLFSDQLIPKLSAEFLSVAPVFKFLQTTNV